MTDWTRMRAVQWPANCLAPTGQLDTTPPWGGRLSSPPLCGSVLVRSQKPSTGHDWTPMVAVQSFGVVVREVGGRVVRRRVKGSQRSRSGSAGCVRFRTRRYVALV
jgi:hypothetical protein